jgi:CubicO group peptidase (beta-lactamase class C family)
MTMQGHVASGFEPVRAAFAANFARDGEFAELGAALAVFAGGECVVDLHGGYRDVARVSPWTPKTLVNVWSASKGVLAVAIAQLVEAGKLHYERPVADYWPGFAAAGNHDITVAQVLSHQAGLNGFADPTAPRDLLNWDTVVERLQRQRPFWAPGSLTSYHAMTYGWLAGEILRRVTGLSVRDYVRRYIAEPLRLDLWLGCPPDRRIDVATIVPPRPDRSPVELNEVARRAVINPEPDAEAANTAEWRDAQLPAVNVHCTALGLARMYAALANGGEIDGVRLLSARSIDELRRVRSPGPDQMLGPRRWASGVSLNHDGQYGPDPDAFGHAGWGGSVGFASVATNVAVAYVVNRMGSKLNGDPRAGSICDAVFRCVAR